MFSLLLFVFLNLSLTYLILISLLLPLFLSNRVFNVLDSEEKYEEPNISNECEAEFVVRLVQLLVTSSLAGSKSIGVISFYQKQRSLIQEKLKSR